MTNPAYSLEDVLVDEARAHVARRENYIDSMNAQLKIALPAVKLIENGPLSAGRVRAANVAVIIVLSLISILLIPG